MKKEKEPIVCPDCDDLFIPYSTSQKRCTRCAHIQSYKLSQDRFKRRNKKNKKNNKPVKEKFVIAGLELQPGLFAKEICSISKTYYDKRHDKSF
jgi:DNA-directed RNA polymerase subunit M/transcription elongation factor TFIIS